MSIYHPENWSLIQIEKEGKISFRVFASWRGGYVDCDSWRLNSGVKKASFNGTEYVFEGHSGSEYICHPDKEGNHSAYNQGILDLMLERILDGMTVKVISL